MSHPFTYLTMLSRSRYICFLLDGFCTFSLFISFLLTSFWIVLELFKLLVLYWWFLLILPWFLPLSVAILLNNSWSGSLLHSLPSQEWSWIDSLLPLSRGALLTSIALLSWEGESFDWPKFCVFELILEFYKKKIFSSRISDSRFKQTVKVWRSFLIVLCLQFISFCIKEWYHSPFLTAFPAQKLKTHRDCHFYLLYV